MDLCRCLRLGKRVQKKGRRWPRRYNGCNKHSLNAVETGRSAAWQVVVLVDKYGVTEVLCSVAKQSKKYVLLYTSY